MNSACWSSQCELDQRTPVAAPAVATMQAAAITAQVAIDAIHVVIRSCPDHASCARDQRRHAVEDPRQAELELAVGIVLVLERARGNRVGERGEIASFDQGA